MNTNTQQQAEQAVKDLAEFVNANRAILSQIDDLKKAAAAAVLEHGASVKRDGVTVSYVKESVIVSAELTSRAVDYAGSKLTLAKFLAHLYSRNALFANRLGEFVKVVETIKRPHVRYTGI